MYKSLIIAILLAGLVACTIAPAPGVLQPAITQSPPLEIQRDTYTTAAPVVTRTTYQQEK